MSGYRAEFDGVTVESLRAKNCSKWNRYGNEALGAWVADMDFPVCAPIRERLGDMVARSDLGYAPKFDQSGNGPHAVYTGRGSVTAPIVVLATNGFVEGFGFLRNHLIPLITWGSVTRELTPEESARIGGAPKTGSPPPR